MSHNKISQGRSASLQKGIKTTCLSGLWAMGMWLLFALLMVLDSEKMLPWSPFLPRLNTIWAPTGALFLLLFPFLLLLLSLRPFPEKVKGPLRSFWLKSALMGSVLALGIPLTEEAYLGNSRESNSKANAHTLQTMLETYAIAQGQYPDSIQTLKMAASQPINPYWKELTNPYFRSSGIFQSSQPADAVLRVTDANQVGAVVYQPLQNPQGKITAYRIFVYDHRGKKLKIQQNQQMIPFELSNS